MVLVRGAQLQRLKRSGRTQILILIEEIHCFTTKTENAHKHTQTSSQHDHQGSGPQH